MRATLLAVVVAACAALAGVGSAHAVDPWASMTVSPPQISAPADPTAAMIAPSLSFRYYSEPVCGPSQTCPYPYQCITASITWDGAAWGTIPPNQASPQGNQSFTCTDAGFLSLPVNLTIGPHAVCGSVPYSVPARACQTVTILSLPHPRTPAGMPPPAAAPPQHAPVAAPVVADEAPAPPTPTPTEAPTTSPEVSVPVPSDRPRAGSTMLPDANLTGHRGAGTPWQALTAGVAAAIVLAAAGIGVRQRRRARARRHT